MIKIQVVGSFTPNKAETFSAMDYGHANAVAKAIAFLSGEVLPAAVARDHALHDNEEQPAKGFDGTKA